MSSVTSPSLADWANDTSTTSAMISVTRRDDGRLLGMVSLFTAFRALDPDFGDTPEMGWIFDRSVHGKGIAFEACARALLWADETLAAPSYPAIISLENTASMKLAERLGFQRQADATYRGEPIALFRREGRLPAAAASASATPS